jgi:hypothetical protein
MTATQTQFVSGVLRAGTVVRAELIKFRDGPVLRGIVFSLSCVAGWILAHLFCTSANPLVKFLGGFLVWIGEVAQRITHIGGSMFR